MIDATDAAVLVLENPADLPNALCAVNCWAGPDLAGDVEVNNGPDTVTITVGKSWCELAGPLMVYPGVPLCPLADNQVIPAGVPACDPAGCSGGAIYIVDVSAAPTVTVVVTGPADAGPFTVHWGAGVLASTGVELNTPVRTTYTRPGNYTVRVQDQTSGRFGAATLVTVPRVGDFAQVDCPGDQRTPVGRPVFVPFGATSANVATTFTWTATGLPDGVRLEHIGPGTAALMGVPATLGQVTEVVATGDNGYGQQVICGFRWSVVDQVNTVTVANPGDQSSTLGAAVSLALAATDSDPGIDTYTWSAVGLPAGLAIDPATGAITGKPTAGQGPAPVTVTAADGAASTGSTSFLWSVLGKVAVTSPGDQTYTSGAPAEPLTLAATDTDASQTALAWTVTPALPAGLFLDPNAGTIAGTPASAQSKTKYTVTATDARGAAGSATFGITVGNTVAVAEVADQSLSKGAEMTALTAAATDSDPALTAFAWSIAPALPDGLTLDPDAGTIAGTPAATASRKTYTLTATDSTGAAGSTTFSLTVA